MFFFFKSIFYKFRPTTQPVGFFDQALSSLLGGDLAGSASGSERGRGGGSALGAATDLKCASVGRLLFSAPQT